MFIKIFFVKEESKTIHQCNSVTKTIIAVAMKQLIINLNLSNVGQVRQGSITFFSLNIDLERSSSLFRVNLFVSGL